MEAEKGRETYRLSLAGVERDLPLVEVAPGLRIASFVMLGDTKLVEAVGLALAKELEPYRGEIDLLVCPEAKAIPLTQTIARHLDLDYIVARKSLKSYMRSPLVESAASITTQGEQCLVLDGSDAERLKGRSVCIVDDVVSTGGSLASLRRLLARASCTVTIAAAALLEEGGYVGQDLITLGRLPIFRSSSLPEAF